jgi:hypothetical protein
MENTVTIENLSIKNEALMIENAALKAELSEMSAKISWLTELISSSRRKQYGVSSEKAVYDNINVQLAYDMDEPEGLVVIHGENVEPEIQSEKPVRARPKKQGEMSTRLPPGMPVEIVECVLPENELKNDNGEILHPIGKELVRRELKITPAKATIVEIWRMSYVSRENETNGEKVTIVKASTPPQVIKGSMCTPETAAHIIYQKCVMGSPIYRQWQDWKRQGLPIEKQTMINWVIRCSEEYFEPIYDVLHQMIVRETYLNSDGTTIQVLREPGKAPQSESCIWQYRTGSGAARPIILFDYQPDKKQERPRAFLEGFSGYLTTDGSSSYNSLPASIILTGCFSHAHSYFTDTLRCLKDNERQGSLALIGKNYCEKIFDVERGIKDMAPEERFRVRNEIAAPILEEFNKWLKSVEPYVPSKSKIGKAVGYALNQWERLTRYLQDGRVECNNNLSERSFKTLVINRKNFLFATSVAGARATAVLHSITETAKASNLDPYKYMTYVMRTAAGVNIRTNPDLLESLLPQNAPDSCKCMSTHNTIDATGDIGA